MVILTMKNKKMQKGFKLNRIIFKNEQMDGSCLWIFVWANLKMLLFEGLYLYIKQL